MVTITELDPFVNAGDERNSKNRSQALNQNGNALAGMCHDVLGLGVIGGLLMQEFDGRHLAPFFWIFESIGNKDDAILLGDEVFCEVAKTNLDPDLGQTLKVDGGAVECVAKSVIATVF